MSLYGLDFPGFEFGETIKTVKKYQRPELAIPRKTANARPFSFEFRCSIKSVLSETWQAGESAPLNCRIPRMQEPRKHKRPGCGLQPRRANSLERIE